MSESIDAFDAHTRAVLGPVDCPLPSESPEELFQGAFCWVCCSRGLPGTAHGRLSWLRHRLTMVWRR